jgi:hypothetical protein
MYTFRRLSSGGTLTFQPWFRYPESGLVQGHVTDLIKSGDQAGVLLLVAFFYKLWGYVPRDLSMAAGYEPWYVCMTQIGQTLSV